MRPQFHPDAAKNFDEKARVLLAAVVPGPRQLRVIGARTQDVLIEAMSKALDAVSAQDAKGFFAHCGYCGLEQQL